MYEAYFNLPKRPFSSTPDASCFFASESIQELFDELIMRAESGQGIGILTAQAGTGKTLLCRRLVSELSSRWTPVFLANANFPTRRALLQSILFELGKPYSGLEEQELRLSIFASLRDLTRAGRGAVLIVDEAHLLSDRLLEELRLLASLAEGKLPLARVILAGQPALEERMMEPALEALNQRVACQVYLEPLTRRQSIDYVEFRIEWAGGMCSQIFTDTALESIAKGAGGLPRCLNQLCDHALLLAYVQELPRVTREIVDEALSTLRQLPLRWNTPVAEQVSNLSDADFSGKNQLVEIDDDACDLSSEGLESSASYMTGSETVCIEIGGDVAMSDSMYAQAESFADIDQPVVNVAIPPRLETSPVSMIHGRPGAGVVPLPDASPQALRGMVDELIVDRYAQLDSSAPRLFRTFDDAALPESWPVKKQDDIPAPPEPPANTAWSAADMVLEEMGDKIDETLDAAPRLVDSLALEPIGNAPCYQESMEIDDLLGPSVMDACLEVQSAIDGGTVDKIRDGHWWNDPSPMINIEDDIVIPEQAEEYAGQYDVIEPEHGAPRREAPLASQPQEDIPFESRSPAKNLEARYVPKPKYRNIFSTLRRRIGRGT
jgi:type II secretory pathway predicted ATPase ExeA